MPFSSIDIDLVVREILDELRRNGLMPATSGVSDMSVASDVSIEPVESIGPGTLVVNERVIALAAVSDHLGTVSRVLVRNDAVVTPLVRDELRRLDVELVRAEHCGKDMVQADSLRGECGKSVETLNATLIIASDTRFDPQRAAAMLSSSGQPYRCETIDCLIDATDRLVGHLLDHAENTASNGRIGLLLTPHIAAAVCLANRNQGVRAVAACDMNTILSDANAIGANMLVADPMGFTTYTLRQTLSRFSDGAPYRCPSWLRSALQ